MEDLAGIHSFGWWMDCLPSLGDLCPLPDHAVAVIYVSATTAHR